MKNWFIEAKKSTDPTIKDLLIQYENLDMSDKAMREEYKAKIKELLPPLDTDEKPAAKVEVVEKIPNNIDFSLKYTEDDVKNAVDILTLDTIYNEVARRVNEIKRQRKRPEYETFTEKKAFEDGLWSIERIGFQAQHRKRLIITEQRRQEKKKSPLSKLAYKQNLFITEYLKGISISNIVLNHKADFNKEDLLLIIDEKVIHRIETESDRYFSEKWERWKKKFLDSNIA